MFRETERQMENYLDDLLVAAKLESPRPMINTIVPRDYQNETVRMKAPARVNIKFEATNDARPKIFITLRYEHAVCHFDINTLQPTLGEIEHGIPQPIKQIIRHINKTFRKFNNEIRDIKRQKSVFNEFKGWTTVRNDLVKSFYDADNNRS